MSLEEHSNLPGHQIRRFAITVLFSSRFPLCDFKCDSTSPRLDKPRTELGEGEALFQASKNIMVLHTRERKGMGTFGLRFRVTSATLVALSVCSFSVWAKPTGGPYTLDVSDCRRMRLDVESYRRTVDKGGQNPLRLVFNGAAALACLEEVSSVLALGRMFIYTAGCWKRKLFTDSFIRCTQIWDPYGTRGGQLSFSVVLFFISEIARLYASAHCVQIPVAVLNVGENGRVTEWQHPLIASHLKFS